MNKNLDMAFEIQLILCAIRSRNRNNTPLSLELQAVFYYQNRAPGRYIYY